jgi:phage gp45-like
MNPCVETSRCIGSEVVIIFFGGKRERGKVQALGSQ